jgi:hypothetical protein
MRSRFAWVIGIVALIACSGDDNKTGDGGPDATTMDTGSNVDTGVDTGIDSGFDSGADSGVDTGNPNDSGWDGFNFCTQDGGDASVVSVTAITPIYGWTGATVPMTITGGGFVSTPTAYLVPNMVPDGGVQTQILNVGFISANSVTGRVPSGLAVGLYDVVVMNPDGCAGILKGAYTSLANAPPKIISVAPGTGTTQTDTNVIVTGCHFPMNATLEAIDANNMGAKQKVNSVTCTGMNVAQCDNTPLCTMDATILTNTNNMAFGAYVIRVNNPTDMTSGTWAAFIVTDPSGKLTGTWTQASSLVNGRRALGLVAGRIDDANRFLYAVGGEDAQGNALDSVEVVPIDAYGRVGKWFVQKYKLTAPRSGLAIARQGRYVYVLGGTSTKAGTAGATPAGTPLDTIERAKILDPSEAPQLNVPQPNVNMGMLAKGGWYYRVSAVMAANDPDNPSGETLASDEHVGLLTAQGEIALGWNAIMGADHYRVYRSPMANGVSGSEVLLKDNIMGTSFTDDGSLMPGMETPLLLGSTGAWSVMSTKLAAATLDASATIVAESSMMNAPLHVYVLGGWGKCTNATGVMDCYQYASISAGGDVLGNSFTLDTTHHMQKARMRFGTTPVTAANGPTQFDMDAGANTASFILASGGMGVQSPGNTIEFALVGNGGGLGAWASATGYANQRDGSQVIMINGYSYAFQGGAVGNYSASTDISTKVTVSPTMLTFGNWSSASVNLPYNVGRHGVALESAYFYAVGGTTNDTDALTNVYQIIY